MSQDYPAFDPSVCITLIGDATGTQEGSLQLCLTEDQVIFTQNCETLKDLVATSDFSDSEKVSIENYCTNYDGYAVFFDYSPSSSMNDLWCVTAVTDAGVELTTGLCFHQSDSSILYSSTTGIQAGQTGQFEAINQNSDLDWEPKETHVVVAYQPVTSTVYSHQPRIQTSFSVRGYYLKDYQGVPATWTKFGVPEVANLAVSTILSTMTFLIAFQII